MWGIVQEKVYKTRIIDLDEQKQQLRVEWAQLDHVIAADIRLWRRRLSVACVTVKAGGGHFECFLRDTF